MNIAYFNYGTVAQPKHTHAYNEEVKNSYVAPTCEKAGSKVMACSCGDKETKTIEPIGHKWGDWEITIEPTLEEVKSMKINDLSYICNSAIVDGVNVGEDVFLIETNVGKNGAHLMKQMIEVRSRLSREKRWKQLDEDVDYRPTQLDKDIVNPSQSVFYAEC